MADESDIEPAANTLAMPLPISAVPSLTLFFSSVMSNILLQFDFYSRIFA
jgi:hypothetical protein